MKKGTELVEYKEQLATQIEEQEEKIKMIEKEVIYWLNTSVYM